MNQKTAALLLGLFSAFPITVSAVPNQITYQGTLKNQGTPVNGLQNMQFTFVDATGNQLVGTSVISVPNVPITQGLFSVQLTIPSNIDWSQVSPYLLIAVGGQQLQPPQAINSNFYSIVSQTVTDGAITTSKLASQSVTGTKIANGTITNMQLSSNSVNTAQLVDQSVTYSKIDSSIINVTIPTGMIAMFATACPSGWTLYSKLQGRAPIGTDPSNPTQFNAGETGGSLSHTHSLEDDGTTVAAYSATYPPTPGNPVGILLPTTTPQPTGSFNGKLTNFATSGPRGSYQVGWGQYKNSMTNSASNLPPYSTVFFCQKN